jgi:diguanylate cyclase (GGDEF)-like protein
MMESRTKEILPDEINFTNAKWYTDLTEKYELYRYNLLRIVLLATSLVPVIYMIIDLSKGVSDFLFNYSVPFVLILSLFTALMITRKTILVSKITLITAIVSFIFTLYAPNAGNVSLIIFFCFPPIAFQLSGTRQGVWWILLFAAVSVLVFSLSYFGFLPQLTSRFPNFWNMVLGFIASILISVIIYFSERQHEQEINVMIRSILLDETTKLPNRKALLHSIKKNTDYLFSIVHIQIENFSDLGLIFGYDLPEKTLLSVAEQLKQLKEKFNYTVFCLKGNEFGILLPLTSNDKEEVYRMMANIRYYLLSTPMPWGNTELRMNIQIGGVIFHSSDTDKLTDILSKADVALKSSIDKHAGVTLFENPVQVQMNSDI